LSVWFEVFGGEGREGEGREYFKFLCLVQFFNEGRGGEGRGEVIYFFTLNIINSK
jgi:hypothetical protein